MNAIDKMQSNATVISTTAIKADICSAAARISTTNGTAIELYLKSIDNPNNKKLAKAVLSSGHQSIMEHCVFNIAFNNVSVFVEQFIIEFRLASFTVQSRRYVDFRNVGFYADSTMQEELLQEYSSHMRDLFSAYGKLIDLGIPKEDARFVLPYCFHSNFYCTCNARELLHIICSMVYGRGSIFPELADIGSSLAQQFSEYFPDEIEKHKEEYHAEKQDAEAWLALIKQMLPFPEPTFADPSVDHLAHTLLNEKSILQLSQYNFAWNHIPKDYKDIITSTRSRELEYLSVAYIIKDISLSAITHFVRHRMQSVMIPCIGNVFQKNHLVFPYTIKNNPEARKIYIETIKNNTTLLNNLISGGIPLSSIVYFALSGNTLDIVSSMNARELVHFLRLRLCNRAQWEIRNIAEEILKLGQDIYPSVFSKVGPSCVISGVCPEGNKSCGRLLRKKKDN